VAPRAWFVSFSAFFAFSLEYCAGSPMAPIGSVIVVSIGRVSILVLLLNVLPTLCAEVAPEVEG
jgi:hypothetical protein